MFRFSAVLIAAFALTAHASAAPITIDFTTTGTVSGMITFDSTGGPVFHPFSGITNFKASFTDGSNSWTEAHLNGKYSAVLGNPSIFLVDLGSDGLDWYWDDNLNGSNDTDIVFFDNGTARLSFGEGDFGGRAYRVSQTGGLPPNAQSGTYSANTGVAAIPEPASLAVFALVGLAGGVVARRRKARVA